MSRYIKYLRSNFHPITVSLKINSKNLLGLLQQPDNHCILSTQWTFQDIPIKTNLSIKP